jgi:class 3 adenylate cyclase
LYIPKYEQEETAPTETVTLVFTDVQSSTGLWEAVPKAMNIALKRHDQILRKLLRKFNGYEVKTEGDAFMVAFFNAIDAIRWCTAVQKALLNATWPEALLACPAAKEESSADGTILFNGIRIRMGIHTGEPNTRPNPLTGRMDYFGTDVNRSARVSDSAHGGQVVCTEIVHQLFVKHKDDANFEVDFPSEPKFVDLGTHKYRGVPEPLRVYQIVDPQLVKREFPPLRTRKAASMHKLLELKNDLIAASPAGAIDQDAVEDVPPAFATDEYTCANPGCNNVESVDRPFGACARCKKVKYCGVECQKSHWKAHKKKCNKGSAPDKTVVRVS